MINERTLHFLEELGKQIAVDVEHVVVAAFNDDLSTSQCAMKMLNEDVSALFGVLGLILEEKAREIFSDRKDSDR